MEKVLDFVQCGGAKVDGRQNRLRDVVGGSVILGSAILTGSSSLFGWAGACRTANFSLGGLTVGYRVGHGNPDLDGFLALAVLPAGCRWRWTSLPPAPSTPHRPLPPRLWAARRSPAWAARTRLGGPTSRSPMIRYSPILRSSSMKSASNNACASGVRSYYWRCLPESAATWTLACPRRGAP